jgi:inosine-uridine nucleoside N-ribohydrolase
VLGSAFEMVLVPLDVTLQVYLGSEELERMEASDRPLVAAVLRLIAEMRAPFERFGACYGLEGSNFKDRVYLHDPLAVEVALGADFPVLRDARIAVGWEGPALRTLEVAEGGREVTVCAAVEAKQAAADWMRVVVG